MGVVQKHLREWWGKGVDLRRRVDNWAVHIFREHNKEAVAWVERGVGGRIDEWEDDSQKLFGPRSLDNVGSGM